jgi:hypothetical protein
MKYLSKFVLTCVTIGACVVVLMFPGLILHEILDRRLNTWSPFHVPYFDVLLLCVCVFLSAWWVASQSWAVFGRWAGVTVLLPILLLQVRHNLDPNSGMLSPDNLWNLLLQIPFVLVLPAVLAFIAGDLGDRRRQQIEQNKS